MLLLLSGRSRTSEGATIGAFDVGNETPASRRHLNPLNGTLSFDFDIFLTYLLSINSFRILQMLPAFFDNLPATPNNNNNNNNNNMN